MSKTLIRQKRSFEFPIRRRTGNANSNTITSINTDTVVNLFTTSLFFFYEKSSRLFNKQAKPLWPTDVLRKRAQKIATRWLDRQILYLGDTGVDSRSGRSYTDQNCCEETFKNGLKYPLELSPISPFPNGSPDSSSLLSRKIPCVSAKRRSVD